MLNTVAKTLRGGGALLVAALLALSLIPVTKAHAGDGFPITLNGDNLEGASVSAESTSFSYTDEWIEIYITPDTGKEFTAAPTMSLHNAEYAHGGQLAPDSNNPGAYIATITRPTGDVTVTVSGTAVASKRTAKLDTSKLKNASASLSKTSEIGQDDTVTLTITPKENTAFATAPVVTADGATAGSVVKSGNLYTCQLTAFTKDATITVEGETVAVFKATLDSTGLKGAAAFLSPDSGLKAADKALLQVVANTGKKFVKEPTVTVDKATATFVSKVENTYNYEITGFTGDATVKVVGEAKGDSFTAALDTNGLSGAQATLDKYSELTADSRVWLKITPAAGNKFVGDPTVTAQNATVALSSKADDGTYLYSVTGFTGNATIKVVGEAKPGKSIDITVNGNGTHVIGKGETLTFTCPLPLEDLASVLMDGKTVDEKNYDKKSGSTIVTLKAAYLDTLAEGKHTLTLAYTGNRAASIDFTVSKSGAKPVPTDGDGKKLAQTGDPFDAAPLAGVIGLSVAALVGAAALRRKHAE